MNAVIVDQRPMVMLEVVVRAHKGAGARGNQRKNERNVKGSLEAGCLKRRGWASTESAGIRDMRTSASGGCIVSGVAGYMPCSLAALVGS